MRKKAAHRRKWGTRFRGPSASLGWGDERRKDLQGLKPTSFVGFFVMTEVMP
jgi:hypothetical protein